MGRQLKSFKGRQVRRRRGKGKGKGKSGFKKTGRAFLSEEQAQDPDVPILLSLSQLKNLGTTIELDPKRDKITCPALGFHNGTYCVGFDDSCVPAKIA